MIAKIRLAVIVRVPLTASLWVVLRKMEHDFELRNPPEVENNVALANERLFHVKRFKIKGKMSH